MWEKEQEKGDKMNGKTYDGYEIIEVLGCGTFGKVFKVKEAKTGQLMAMKHVLQNKKYKNRELEIMRMIQSDFVVKLHNNFYCEEKDGVYLNLIMQYMPETLSKIIKQNYPYKKYLPRQTIIKYAKCLITALKDINAINICHRDIKPSNILVNENEAKLCDFGSAKVLAAGQKNIAYICSRYYRAPELLLGATFYTNQVDVWSLGCVISEMMTNHSLFEGTNSTAMLSKIIKCLGSPSQQDLKNMNLDENELQIAPMEGIGLRNRLKKLNGDCDQQLINLVERMVVYDPLRRITPSQALNLPIFK